MCLINMPFATVALPSIALTQLKSVVEERFGDRVEVRILYLNHDFSKYMGQEVYSMMTNSLVANNSGLGDWFFRQIAFPDSPDNTPEYLQRYFQDSGKEMQALKAWVLAKRMGLRRFMQQLAARNGLEEADLVGFTSMFAQNVATFALARVLKDRRPQIVTVMGGANCEDPMGRELASHVGAIDFVFAGPSLVSFPEFIQHQLDGHAEKCHQVRGVFSRRKLSNGNGSGSLEIGQELPIDVPVALDYESFLSDLQKNFPAGQVRPSLTFETSRGCWWGERSHCTFCGLNGSSMAYRGMPSEQALDLLREMIRRYGERCQRFESVDNIMPRSYLREVFPYLEAPPGTRFFYEVKADLKEHELKVLARAGVTEIQPGIESLATSTLKLMKKGTTAFQNVNFLKNCSRFGIRPSWNLLIGFPGETEEVYKKYLEDIPLLVHLPAPSGAFPVRFDRYSPYFVNAEEYGLDLVPYDFYSAIYPFPEEALKNMAYYFEDRNYGADHVSRMIAWKERLNAGVTAWRQRQGASNGNCRPALFRKCRGSSSVICDSRSGEMVETEVDDLGTRILDLLHSKGLDIGYLARQTQTCNATVGRQIEHLQGLGLLFQEGERFISLVLAGEDG
jgi:magnesium-protoporphyrin IX monomethyl ester (oxidative) cyclase